MRQPVIAWDFEKPFMRDGALAHARQRADREVLGAVEQELGIDLVRNRR